MNIVIDRSPQEPALYAETKKQDYGRKRYAMSTGNVTRLELNGKEYILIGTAHVSRRSTEEVREVIEAERPDSVCIELDETRMRAIVDPDRCKNTDIFTIIKQKKTTALLMNLLISSFQRRLAHQFGVQPGEEMIQGMKSAQEVGAQLVLADRNIQITFARVWRGLRFWDKVKLLFAIISGIFEADSVSEEDVERMKSRDVLDDVFDEFARAFPRVKGPLIDERDQYLAQRIKEAPGKKVVAVVGAAHVPGIVQEIHKDHDVNALTALPPKSKAPAVIGWSIPVVVIGLIVYTLLTNYATGLAQINTWLFWNALLAAAGAAAALAHPAAIVTAAALSPISSLNPLMAAGWFAGIVQAYFHRPTVRDFESLRDEVTTLRGFWTNRVTRVLLVVALTNVGSSLGAVFGGANVVRLFFGG